MKKTLNINLDGYPFQIEEDAYELLRNYLQRIEAKMGRTAEAKEVVNDIESRIAELFRMEGRMGPTVITQEQVAEVIRTIGEPDDFIDNAGSPEVGEETDPKQNHSSSQIIEKRLYRNPFDKVLGGVCSGLGAYFNVDVLIVRILFVLGFLLSAGTVVTLLYLVLWIAIPKAVLTEQKLAMQGGFSFAESTTQGKSASQPKTAPATGQSKSSYLSIALRNIGKGIISIMGFFVFLIGLLGMLALGIAAVSGYSLINSEWNGLQFGELAYLLTPDGISMVVWIAAGVLVALPLVFFMYLGLRMMMNFKAYMGMVIAVMLFFWLIALGIIFYHGLDAAMSFRKSCERSESISLQPFAQNVLYINRMDSSAIRGTLIEELSGDNYDVVVDSISGKPLIFGLPEIRVEYGDTLGCRVITSAHGRDLTDAMKFRQQIRYRIRQVDSVVYCDERFGLGNENLFRVQSAGVVFTIPKGTRVVVDPSMSQLVEF